VKNDNLNIKFKSYPGLQQSSAIVWSLLLLVDTGSGAPPTAAVPLQSIASAGIRAHSKKLLKNLLGV
jgi:hypothetical protein